MSGEAENRYRVELIRCTDLSASVRSFECRLMEGRSFRFEAGQFVSLTFTLDDIEYTRSYSLSSCPGDGDRLEIVAKNNPGGPGTRFLWGMKPGFRFAVDGPFGTFRLRTPDVHRSLFIAAGTGIAPIRSMLLFALQRSVTSDMILLFGVPGRGDLLYDSEFRRLAREHKNFSYHAVLSRPSNGWDGLSGYVQHHLETLAGEAADMNAYLSGPPQMVEDVRRELEARGFDPASINYEGR